MQTIKRLESRFEQGNTKYFSNAKKGEIYELKAELNSDKPQRRKEAVKKVIASMTLGKDVSALFPDIVNCMQASTDGMEMKKLIYLYIMNYARNQPDLALMAVNTFQKDCLDHNPLIRALAIRTMGNIRVDKITDYLCGPLKKCLKDSDPYVRKTAVVCVSKMYGANPQLVEDQDFLSTLQEMLADGNPMVVANVVAAISEISEIREAGPIKLGPHTIPTLLTALNDCTEWGRVFILDFLANQNPADSNEAANVCGRVSLRLQDSNSAVVLSAVKVLLKYVEYVRDSSIQEETLKKIGPPLVTLLSSSPELQYVALRNITLIIQWRPDLLRHEMQVFYVKYNDPIYVKMEKLDIMVRLASDDNVDMVLAELKQYSNEVDVEFVRESVSAIGRVAVKLEKAAEQCVSLLLELIKTKAAYVVQEAVVVLRDIFRRYPNRYEAIIGELCDHLETLDEAEAKAAMLWIVGEYSDRIDNADELLASFAETFKEEASTVQLQLLTATVKLFLRRPQLAQELVKRVLAMATQESDNPDVRDRAFFYWRLLSASPVTAKAVVLAERELISEETEGLDKSVLRSLVANIGSLASVYHKPSWAFLDTKQTGKGEAKPSSAPGGHDEEEEPMVGQQTETEEERFSNPATASGGLNLLDLGETPDTQLAPMEQNNFSQALGLDDLLGDTTLALPITQPGFNGPISSTNEMSLHELDFQSMFDGGVGLFGDQRMEGSGAAANEKLYVAPKTVCLSAQQGKGMEISATLCRVQRQIFLDMTIVNRAMQPITDLALQLSRNSFGLALGSQESLPKSILPAQSTSIRLPINTAGPVQRMTPLNRLQIAVKNNFDIFYFDLIYTTNVLFLEDAHLTQDTFMQAWCRTLGADKEVNYELHGLSLDAQRSVETRLCANNIGTVAHQSADGQESWYFALKYSNNIWVLGQLIWTPGSPVAALVLKSNTVDVLSLAYDVINAILHC